MTKTLTDETLVTQTVLDYFESWFTGDVERMDRALHPDLVKRGPTLAVTTKERMLELTARGEGLQDGVAQLTRSSSRMSRTASPASRCATPRTTSTCTSCAPRRAGRSSTRC